MFIQKMFYDKSTQTKSLQTQMPPKCPLTIDKSTQTKSLSLTNADFNSTPPAKKARYNMDQCLREDKDYSSLQSFLLKETSPCDLEHIIIYIGFPEKKLAQLKYDYPQNFQKLLIAMFEIWFPIAQRAASVDNITPREIVAYAYNSNYNTKNFRRLLDSELRRNFVKSNKNKFDLLTTDIEKQIEDAIDSTE